MQLHWPLRPWHSPGCNLLLRDVSKAFDRVWHLGLKYKILHLGLPVPVEHLLCDFLEDRTARIRVGDHLGPVFPLATKVSQGSVLSPSLYSIYTSDCPVSDAGINVLYADDVSQVVFHPSRSSRMANARTGTEIARIYNFEKEWKIRSNLAKFSLILPCTSCHQDSLLADRSGRCRPQHGGHSPILEWINWPCVPGGVKSESSSH